MDRSLVLKEIIKGKEIRGIAVTIGNTVHIITPDDPEWNDWKSVPSYDDPEMILNLMIGNYVDEYKALISEDITRIVTDETVDGSDWSELLDQAYDIYHGIPISGGFLFERFYDLLYDMVCIYYQAAFLDEPLCQSNIAQCRKDYTNLISMVCEHKKGLRPAKDNSGLILFPDKQIQNIENLAQILNMLIQRFYEQAIKYGAYFRTYDKQCTITSVNNEFVLV